MPKDLTNIIWHPGKECAHYLKSHNHIGFSRPNSNIFTPCHHCHNFASAGCCTYQCTRRCCYQINLRSSVSINTTLFMERHMHDFSGTGISYTVKGMYNYRYLQWWELKWSVFMDLCMYRCKHFLDGAFPKTFELISPCFSLCTSCLPVHTHAISPHDDLLVLFVLQIYISMLVRLALLFAYKCLYLVGKYNLDDRDWNKIYFHGNVIYLTYTVLWKKKLPDFFSHCVYLVFFEVKRWSST